MRKPCCVHLTARTPVRDAYESYCHRRLVAASQMHGLHAVVAEKCKGSTEGKVSRSTQNAISTRYMAETATKMMYCIIRNP